MEPLKAEQLTSVKWRVLSIPFGGPFAGGTDLDGEYFSARTDIKDKWFKTRPVLWHHGQDETIKDEAIGTEDDLVKEDDGWWGTMWLDRSARYWAQVSAMLASGKVYGSSGSAPHLVRVAKDGEILKWPHIEQTLTLTPSNFFSRVVPAKAAADFISSGISLGTDLETYLSSRNDGESSATARLATARAQSAALLARIKTI